MLTGFNNKKAANLGLKKKKKTQIVRWETWGDGSSQCRPQFQEV